MWAMLFVVLTFASSCAGMALAPGANVLVVGNGAVQCLAARLAAIGGYQTTLATLGESQEQDKKLVYDDAYPEGSIPLTIMPVTGEQVDVEAVEKCIMQTEGLIVAFDGERTLPEPSMNVFLPSEGGTSIKHVTVMSRYLNGAGMGFTASAAKVAANPDVWAGGKAVEAYKKMEASITARAQVLGAATTIIRAGTLKGGASGDKTYSTADAAAGAGEKRFLNPFFYTLGQQDIVNWRLLYDVDALGVEISAGDTLPGPGFTAALTATDRVGQGDSHRGAVAQALVTALGCDAAKGRDYSVKATEGRDFPPADAWPGLLEAAK